MRRRDALTERAAELMRERSYAGHTLHQLADDLGCTTRTLELGFRDRYGTTPHGYFHRVRLQHAHQDLREGRGSVTDVAHAWGFHHLGRFAAAYRREFGERPSDTLSRTRRETASPPTRDCPACSSS